MNWEEHKSKLIKETENAFNEAVDALEDGDKICSIFYYISMQDSVTFVFDSVSSKRNHFNYARNKAYEKWQLEDSSWDVQSRFKITEHYEEFSSLGLDFAEEGSYYYQDSEREKSFDTDSDEYKEYRQQDIKAAIEAQLALEESSIMKSDKVTEIVDLSFSLGQGDLCSNGFIIKK